MIRRRVLQYKWLLIAWVFVNIADGISTFVFISSGGEEGNPILSTMLTHGWPLFWIYKMVGTLFVAFLFLHVVRFMRLLKTVTILFGAVAVLNLVTM